MYNNKIINSARNKVKIIPRRQLGGLTEGLTNSLMPEADTKGERIGKGVGQGVGSVADMALNMVAPGLGSLGLGKSLLGAAGQGIGSAFKPDTADADDRKRLDTLTHTRSNDISNAYGTPVFQAGGTTPSYSWSTPPTYSNKGTSTYKIKSNQEHTRTQPARSSKYERSTTPYQDNISRDKNSNLENFIEILDPTGISSHDDLAKSQREGTDTPLDYLSVVPLVGKLGKVMKALHLSATMKDTTQFMDEGLAAEQNSRETENNQMVQKQVGGANKEPDYEAEHNEVVIKNHPGESIQMHGSGQLADESSYAGTIKGDHHGEDTDNDGQEGEAMSGGEYILSDIKTLDYRDANKKNGKSAAAVARPLVRKINEAEKSKDIYKQNTLKFHVKELEQMKEKFDTNKNRDGLYTQLLEGLGINDSKQLEKQKNKLREGVENGELSIEDLTKAVSELQADKAPSDYQLPLN
jgi:hypothetical protein